MIKIAICDDEQKDREKLYNIIQEFMSEILRGNSLKQFSSGELFFESKFRPDILFLDIMMEEKDGIQVGNEVKRCYPDTMIIYITQIKEKISTAINRIHAFGYLQKPVMREEVFALLFDAIDCLKQNVRKSKVTFLSEGRSIIELPVHAIYYFEYLERKVKIVTEGENYFCKEKINEIAAKMEPYGFAMCHQSFVVNLYEVDRIVPPNLIMRNKDLVDLAQKRQSAIRKRIMQIARESI